MSALTSVGGFEASPPPAVSRYDMNSIARRAPCRARPGQPQRGGSGLLTFAVTVGLGVWTGGHGRRPYLGQHAACAPSAFRSVDSGRACPDRVWHRGFHGFSDRDRASGATSGDHRSSGRCAADAADIVGDSSCARSGCVPDLEPERTRRYRPSWWPFELKRCRPVRLRRLRQPRADAGRLHRECDR